MSKCTPEYNAETRALMRRAAELKRIAKGAETGDFGAAIRAKANELIDAGGTAESVVKDVQAFISEYAPHTNEEVANAISGYGKERVATIDEARDRRNAIRAELRDLARVQELRDGSLDDPEKAEAARNRSLERQIEDLTRQIENNVKNEKAAKRPESDATKALREKRDALQEQLNPKRPPLTPDERKVAALEKQLADILAGRKPNAPINGPDTQRVAELKKQIAAAREAAKPVAAPTDPELAREEATRRRLENEIAKLDEKIAARDTSQPGRRQGPDSAEVAALKAERAAKKELLNNMRPAPAPTRPVDPSIAKNKARQTALKKQLADLERRIAENDFTPPAKRSPVQYAADTRALIRERDAKVRQYETMLRRQEEANQSLPAKVARVINKIHLMNILSSVFVYPKLVGAVIARYITTPAEAAIVSAAKAVIPGLRGLAEKAPVYGAGFDPEAEAAYYKAIKDAPKEALNQILQGQSSREAEFADAKYTAEYTDVMTSITEMTDAVRGGDKKEATRAAFDVVTSIPGRTHAAVKEFAATPMFDKAYLLHEKAMRAALKKQGLSPKEIAERMSSEETRAMLGAKAIAHAWEAKLQGENKLADGINRMVSAWEKGGSGEKAVALLFRTLFPIRKIPLNIVKEISSYTLGGVKAAAAVRAAKKAGMTEERAEYIFKNIGKQGIGFVLIATGIALSASLGGTAGTQGKDDEIEGDHANIAGFDPGSGVFHSPAAQMLQIGAALARLYSKKYGSKDGINAALNSLGDTYGQVLARGIPYFDQVRRFSNTVSYGRGPGEFVGNVLRSMVIPLPVQQAAAAHDPNKGFRHPRDMVDDVKLGIPVLREEVPAHREKKRRY